MIEMDGTCAEKSNFNGWVSVPEAISVSNELILVALEK